MAIQEDVLEVFRVLGGGVVKKPGDPLYFARVARQYGYDKVATWVETHPAEYQVLLAAAAGWLEVEDDDE